MGSNIAAMAEEHTILDMFKAIERGDFIIDLEQSVREVVADVVELQKKGSVTIKLDFQYDHQTEAMKLVPKVTMKKPERPRRANLFYVTPDGLLSRYDSRQRDFFDASQHMKVKAPQPVHVGVDPAKPGSDTTVKVEVQMPQYQQPESGDLVDPLTGEIVRIGE